jgi:hypothetical protein
MDNCHFSGEHGNRCVWNFSGRFTRVVGENLGPAAVGQNAAITQDVVSSVLPRFRLSALSSRNPIGRGKNLGRELIRHGHEATYIGVAVHDESEVGGHHLFPTLKSLVNPPVGIGIELIVYGIVVAKFEVHPGARG